jgi:hypothetical protein
LKADKFTKRYGQGVEIGEKQEEMEIWRIQRKVGEGWGSSTDIGER